MSFTISLSLMLMIVFIIKVDYEGRATSGYMDNQTVFAIRQKEDGKKSIVVFNRELKLPDFLKQFFDGNE